MKKLLSLLLSFVLLFSLAACGGSDDGEKEPAAVDYTATEEDKAVLEKLYEGLQMHHGQLHDHAKTGRRSDGKATLDEWKAGMPDVGMEYVALLDHRQTDHMYLPEWDPTLFISGSEAMTYISDRDARFNKFHYNMIVRNVADMEAVLKNHMTTYTLVDGLFDYRAMSSTEFTQVIQEILDAGGYFVIPHPAQTAAEVAPDGHEGPWVSENLLDYYFCDGIGYEVFYHISEKLEDRTEQTKANYGIWTGLLAMGKKVYCSAGSDVHNLPTDRGLSTVYSSQKLDTSYIEQLRKGNYTAGPVGVRMNIGETTMGGTGDFSGKRVVFSVGDFHENFLDTTHTYRVDLVSDTGVVFSQKFVPGETQYFAVDADENAKFYRVEVHDESLEYSLLALGNPIWND